MRLPPGDRFRQVVLLASAKAKDDEFKKLMKPEDGGKPGDAKHFAGGSDEGSSGEESAISVFGETDFSDDDPMPRRIYRCLKIEVLPPTGGY